jgi:hypothetical protein
MTYHLIYSFFQSMSNFCMISTIFHLFFSSTILQSLLFSFISSLASKILTFPYLLFFFHTLSGIFPLALRKAHQTAKISFSHNSRQIPCPKTIWEAPNRAEKQPKRLWLCILKESGRLVKLFFDIT